MPDLAIDALSTTISPGAIKAAGYIGVLNYLRNVTRDVVDGYHAVGLGFGSIFETEASESLGGAAAGIRDGQTAYAQMIALGQPRGTLHVVNLGDFAPIPSEVPVIRDYWTAYVQQVNAWSVIPYGTGWLLQQLALYGWQNAMDNNGFSGSMVVPEAVLYQRVRPTRSIPNASYDEDVVISPLHWWVSSVPIPVPAPPPQRPWWNPWNRIKRFWMA